jgi:hypothetical protein
MNIDKKLLIFILILIVCYILINKSFSRYELPFNKLKTNAYYHLVIILLVTFIMIYVLTNNFENYKNINEDVFTGIKGKTTMSNLQNLQNNEIQQLEEKARFVKTFLHNKNKEIEKTKYRKIPIENSCVILNSQGNNNMDKPVQDHSMRQTLPLSNTSDVTKEDMKKISEMINNSSNN